MPTIEEWKKFWMERSKNENSELRDHQVGKKILKIIANGIRSTLSLKPSDKLLDVGCGTGDLLSLVAKDISNVTGADYDPIVVKHLQKKMKKIRFYLAAANRLPFEDGSFDKVLCYSVFHYFPDYEYAIEVLKELMRGCKKGGIIMVGDVPHKPPFYSGIVSFMLRRKYDQLGYDPSFFYKNVNKSIKIIEQNKKLRPKTNRFDVVINNV
jgi:ubiquinone/menaquinone biosynthesis C-methylase UbiE